MEELVVSVLKVENNIDRLAPLGLVCQPGEEWNYSLSYDVLGRIIEIVSGQSLDDFFKENIFGPLGMDHTFFKINQEDADHLAELYTINSDGELVEAHEGINNTGGLKFSKDYPVQESHKYLSGGAGLVSTISDYGLFLETLLNKGKRNDIRILKKRSVKTMTRNQIGGLNILPFSGHGDKYGYGFGVLSREDVSNDVAGLGTYSWGGIFNTYYWVDP